MAVAAIVAIGAGIWAFAGGSGSSETDSGESLLASDVALGMIDSHRPKVGKPAPDFVLVNGRDGTEAIRLSDFRGTPVVLNWYATWCGPCRAEIPDFKAADDTLGDDLIILGVNLQEPPEKAVGLLDEFGASYPTVMDADASVFEHYRGVGMPTTYFIDADGIIVSGGSGLVTEKALVGALSDLGIDYTPPEDN